MRAGDDGILQRALALNDIAQVKAGVQSQHHIHVGQS